MIDSLALGYAKKLTQFLLKKELIGQTLRLHLLTLFGMQNNFIIANFIHL